VMLGLIVLAWRAIAPEFLSWSWYVSAATVLLALFAAANFVATEIRDLASPRMVDGRVVVLEAGPSLDAAILATIGGHGRLATPEIAGILMVPPSRVETQVQDLVLRGL
jgi:hypothetical protein